MSLVHRVRLILAGILVSLGAAALAQIGGSGVTSPPGPQVLTGTFDITWDVGCTVPQEMAIEYYRVGDLVALVPDQANLACDGDSNNTWSSDAADFPAELVPEGNVYVTVVQFSGGSENHGCWILRGHISDPNDGQMSLVPASNCVSGSWNATGARQWSLVTQVPVMVYPVL